jgi:glycyl-tRNA synthetase beta chain
VSDLLFEIGAEELPPMAVAPALEQLAREARAAFEVARLAVKEVRATGTVRRLVLMADGLAGRQADRASVVRGPAARVAYDGSGQPTQAAIGFARSQGVPVGALQVREMDGGRYVVAEVREAGRPATTVLRELLPALVAGLSFPKTMRWRPDGFRFGRPIRWIVALLDGRVVPLDVAGVRAGRRTPGHRFLSPRAVSLKDARAYAPAMRTGRVVLDPAERRARIIEGATAAAKRVGGRPVLSAVLLEELVWSTEHPTPLLGAIDEALVGAIPRAVILVTLQHHQKCFGVDDARGRLLPAFIAVRDGGTSHLASVRTGHEWVVRARLADARFFLDEDRRGAFAQWNEDLSRVAYLERQGTMGDHVRRLRRVAGWLAQAAGAGAPTAAAVDRAAAICKADLVTQMVREFPELQGTIGGIYAREQGEPEAVARAVQEHYLPRDAGDAPPESLAGALLALADRTTMLAGAFLVGLEPTGSADPYGLRRAASGMVGVLTRHSLRVSLGALFREAVGTYEHNEEARNRAVEAATTFVLQRLRAYLIDMGILYDEVDAVLATGQDDVSDLVARSHALHRVRARPVMARLATGFARASRILGQGTPAPVVDAGLLAEPAETDLHQAWERVRGAVEQACEARRYEQALETLVGLADPIDAFYDKVLVMAEDAAVRANRLALLKGIRDTFLRVADFSKLAGERPGAADTEVSTHARRPRPRRPRAP